MMLEIKGDEKLSELEVLASIFNWNLFQEKDTKRWILQDENGINVWHGMDKDAIKFDLKRMIDWKYWEGYYTCSRTNIARLMDILLYAKNRGSWKYKYIKDELNKYITAAGRQVIDESKKVEEDE